MQKNKNTWSNSHSLAVQDMSETRNQNERTSEARDDRVLSSMEVFTIDLRRGTTCVTFTSLIHVHTSVFVCYLDTNVPSYVYI